MVTEIAVRLAEVAGKYLNVPGSEDGAVFPGREGGRFRLMAGQVFLQLPGGSTPGPASVMRSMSTSVFSLDPATPRKVPRVGGTSA